MTLTEEHRNQFLQYLEVLPEEKLVELRDFADFLVSKTRGELNSQVDEASMRLQQQALEQVWADPAEDLYEL